MINLISLKSEIPYPILFSLYPSVASCNRFPTHDFEVLIGVGLERLMCKNYMFYVLEIKGGMEYKVTITISSP